MSGNKDSSGSGNLNRARIDAKPREGTSGTKDNSECSSLRPGNLPQAEEVTVVDADKNSGAAIAAAQRQNESDEMGPAGRNVVPSGREFPTRTHGHK